MHSEEELSAVVSGLLEAEMRAMWFLTPDSKLKGLDRSSEDDMRSYYKEWAIDERMLNCALLTSKNLFTANVNNMSSAKSTVYELSHMDKLPQRNTLGATTVLKSAWCLYDICQYNRSRYRRISQILFLLQNLIVISTITVTVLNFERVGADSEHEMLIKFDAVVFYLALLSAFVGGVDAFFNPTTRWKTLQGEMARLESHIWRFRTRSGEYEHDNADPKAPEVLLRNVVERIRKDILVNSDVSETAYLQNYPPSTFRHGQFRPQTDGQARLRAGGRISPQVVNAEGDESKQDAGPKPNETNPFDNHASPCPPALYITFRVEPKIEEFRSMLPRLGWTRSVLRMVLLLATGTSAVLANVKLSNYVAILSGVTCAITGWLEFHNTESRVIELNASIMNLENLVMWWNSLTEIERAVVRNINELIDQGEEYIAAADAEKRSKTEKGKEPTGSDSQGQGASTSSAQSRALA